MANSGKFQTIETYKELKAFCKRMESAPIISFDTEFVSEDRYLPELCLLQVAGNDEIVLIDSLKLGDEDELFWEFLSTGDHVSVCHAGREEYRFSFRFSGNGPANLIDVQVAAGLAGFEYPAAYSNLVSKIAGKNLSKGETRSDWRRRPLSDSQLEYAAQDVIYLETIYRKIMGKLERQGRREWLSQEMGTLTADWAASLNREEQWKRLSGLASLDERSLGIAKQIWLWREETAYSKDQSPRKLLRDDLLVELARKKSPSTKKIKSVRGMERRQTSRYLDDIAAAIEEGLNVAEQDLPDRIASSRVPQLGQLGQFLTAAIGITCREQKIAPGIFGTTNELRELAAWRLGMIDKPTSRLLDGWRSEMIMPILDGLLKGSIGLKVRNAKSNNALQLIDLEGWE